MFDVLRPMRIHRRLDDPSLRTAPLVLISVLLTAALVAPVGAQQIYKTVDENGNVVYTDQKPSEDAEPIPLPELTVVDPVELGDPSAAPAPEPGQRDITIEFDITSPIADEVIVNTGFRLDVQVDLGIDLPRGAQIVYRVDGEEKLRSRQLSVTLEGIERGPHQVSAELVSADGRVVASTSPVSFFMRQQSALYRRPG